MSKLVPSFNKNDSITPNTKLLIVGTLTPPQGQNSGYFYTAPKNRIYGYIDAATNKTNLKELKGNLKDAPNKTDLKEAIIEEIIKVLKENNIAFLDVIDKAVRKDENSYLDSDIAEYTLDYESFKKLKDHKNLTVISNSKFAESGYNTIKEKLKTENIDLPEAKYLPQRGKGSNKSYWLKTIKEALK